MSGDSRESGDFRAKICGSLEERCVSHEESGGYCEGSGDCHEERVALI